MKNRYFETAMRFCSLLDNENIAYDFHEIFDGYQWTNITGFEGGDIVIHSGSYNNENGYVESYGMPWDNDDVTSCSVEEMIDLITGRINTPRNKYNYTLADLLESFSKAMNNT